MKPLGKFALALGLILFLGNGVMAQDVQNDRIETTITQIEGRIIQLEHQLLDLKEVNKKALTKTEKKRLRHQKKALRQALAAERNVLNRLTRPDFVWFGPYGPAYYTAFGPWGYWDPFLTGYPFRHYPVRRIYVAPDHHKPKPPKNVVPDRTPRRPNTAPAPRRVK